MIKNIVIIGLPGSGKGVQSQILSDVYGIKIISAGAVLRKTVEDADLLTKSDDKNLITEKIKSKIEKGELVEDFLICDMMNWHLNNINLESSPAIIWDGFPRSEKQAIFLDQILFNRNQFVNYVIFINASVENLENRIKDRCFCSDCGNISNLSSLKDGKCKKCGSNNLKTRADDDISTFKNRIIIGQRIVNDLLKYYRDKNNLILEVNGDNDPLTVSNDILNLMNFREWLVND